VLGPGRNAISGVTTHLNTLLDSKLQESFDLFHFRVGSEGRRQSSALRMLRIALSPAALALEILRRDAAVVHLNTSLNARAYWRDLAYLLVARACGARVLLQKHGGSMEDFCGRSGAFAELVRATLKLADAVVVLSRAELNEYEELLPGGKVVLVPNGIDCAPYRKYNRLPADPAAPLRLVYIGRLAPRKGLTELLEGFALLRAEGVAARLAIVGSGPEEGRLKVRAKALGVGAGVSFPGPAYGEDKARLLSLSDVLLLPSYSEGLPYSLLEAMAAGVVPVVTRVGAIPDVMRAGTHGLFVPVRDAKAIAGAVAELASDRAWLARMSAACRSRAATMYSAERLAADFAGLYAALHAPRSPRPVL
jgi:glycosyltransferase involved in cell wall biosynthesis